MRFSQKLIGLFLSLFLSWSVNAQCNVNTSICNGANAGPFTFVTPGNPVSTCLDFWGPNVGYIILNISQAGNLNMLIDANTSGGFIDVAVFNVPPGVSPCTAINSTSNQILCNYASSASGCAQFGGQFGCPSNIGTVQVQAGQQLMIVAENWSGTNSNFTLHMSSAPGSAVAGQPDATINPVNDICVSGNPIQLSAPSMGGTWSGPGVSPTGMFNPATAGIGTHTITYNVGVAPCNSQGTTTINVIADPVINLTSNSPVCNGETIEFTVDSILISDYSWSGPNGFSSTSTAVLIYNATPAHSGTYTVTINHGGCVSTATTDVVVNPAVTIDVAPVSPMCLHDGVYMNQATVTSPSGTVYTGTWSGPGIVDSTSGSFNPEIAGVGTHTITYEVGGACGNVATTDVIVKPHPIYSVSSSLTAACSPLNTDVVIGSNIPLDDVLIDFGNGKIGDSLGVYPQQYVAIGDSIFCYSVSVSGASQGCASDTIFLNYFCPYPLPVAQPAVESVTADVYNPVFQFMNQSENSSGAIWDFGDNTHSNQDDPIHTYSNEPQDYTVTLSVENEYECRDTAMIHVRVIEDVLLFVPNSFTPDGDEFNNVFKPILATGIDMNSYTLLIYNRWGQLVFESHDANFGWDGTYNGVIAQVGTYTWMITFKSKENSENFKHYGFVNIIK